jgi:deoxyribodipyrimidine photolyase
MSTFTTFLAREVKFAEAAFANMAANSLNSNAPALEAAVDAAAPKTVATLIAAIEKADASMGPAESAFINGTLNSYAPLINQELTALLAQGSAQLVPTVVTALQTVAAKLQAEALAL